MPQRTDINFVVLYNIAYGQRPAIKSHVTAKAHKLFPNYFGFRDENRSQLPDEISQSFIVLITNAYISAKIKYL